MRPFCLVILGHLLETRAVVIALPMEVQVAL